MLDTMRSWSRRHARLLFVGGLVALAASVVAGLGMAYGDEQRFLGHREAPAGDAVLWWYAVPPLADHERAALDIRSPDVEADVFLVGCEDLDRLRAGEPPASPRRSARIHESGDLEVGPADVDPLVTAACPSGFLAVRWPSGTAEPFASASIVADPLRTPAAPAAFALGALGAGAMLVGALADATLFRPDRLPAAVPGESTAEAFLRLAARAEGWLVRTRRYLRLLGGFGLLPWYPLVLSFGLVAVGREDGAVYAWIALGAAAVLLACTAMWWRRLREVDHELAVWRERMGRLRAHEEELLAEP